MYPPSRRAAGVLFFDGGNMPTRELVRFPYAQLKARASWQMDFSGRWAAASD
jgi:hypothetical protein